MARKQKKTETETPGTPEIEPRPGDVVDPGVADGEAVESAGTEEETVVTPGPGEPIDGPGTDPVAVAETSIDDVLAMLAGPVGAPRVSRQRSPTPRLSGGQAELQARIYLILHDRGVRLRGQERVYPWLLDQIAKAVAPDDKGGRS